ncbi:hypothetical protein NPIL_226421 [Nephila pilipes]|uniref:Uncharacterized protein n=1 Tax=Nephila pilipes TaxID=299642 RepID=A0A8X6USD4_NEPPI|nr:hypothetical protein NPIL_226421 [Nephila pilipes]
MNPTVSKHGSGKHNHVDILTRGLVSRYLINSEKWCHGPELIRDPEDLWPKEKESEYKSVNSLKLLPNINLALYSRIQKKSWIQTCLATRLKCVASNFFVITLP